MLGEVGLMPLPDIGVAEDGGAYLQRLTQELVAGGQCNRVLAGMLLRPDESPAPGIVLWSLADNTYRRLTQTGRDPEFLDGGRGILFLERGEVRLVDAASGEARTLLPLPPHSTYESASAGPGDRTICTVRTTDEGDIWMVSLGDSAGRP